MGPNAQTEKGFENKIPENKGSWGVNIQNSPLAATFLIFIRFLKCFRFIVQSGEYNLKNMV